MVRPVNNRRNTGNTTALRLCLDRICPPLKERRIDLCLPKVTEIEHGAEALGSILEAAGQGEISVEQAEGMAHIAEAQDQMIEAHNLEERVAALEKLLYRISGRYGTEALIDWLGFPLPEELEKRLRPQPESDSSGKPAQREDRLHRHRGGWEGLSRRCDWPSWWGPQNMLAGSIRVGIQ